MQGLNIADEGLLYIFKCIKEYSGQGFYLLLYAAALVFLFLKGEKEHKRLFVWPAVAALLTVYNPILPVIIDHFFDVNDEYYRLLWISPVIITIALVLILIVGKAESPAKKAAFYAAGLLILMAAGSPVYSGGYTPAVNIYKMPPEVVAVSHAIHKDTDEEFPRAACDFDLGMQIRQYDASILLTATREEYLNMLQGIEVDEFIAEKQKHPNRILEVVLLNHELPVEEFKESLEETDTSYIVISSGSPVKAYLKKAGLKVVAEAGGRDIWRYDWEGHKPFEPADYSEVWAAQ